MYKLTDHGAIIRIADNASFLPEDDNPNYQAYRLWCAEGNTPEPADPAPAPDYSAMRSQAYRDESDPLYFKWQREEATKQQWIDKVAEIKARWPE